MANTIEAIVNVDISRQTKAVQRAAFNVMLFLGRHKFWGERYRAFSDLTEMVAAGVPSNSAEYLAAQLYFAQSNSPDKIAIGRQDPTKVILTPTVANSTEYTIDVGANGATPVEVSFTSDVDATDVEIAAGLTAAINGSSAAVAMVATSVAGTVEITQISNNVAVVNNWSTNLVATYVATESIADALIEVSAEDDTWYGLGIYSHAGVDQLSAAGHVETRKKLFGYGTGNTSDPTSSTLGIGAQLQALGYNRSFGLYDIEAGVSTDPVVTTVTYPTSAWFGEMLTKQPGSATWKFKTLEGIEADSLTTTESDFLVAKNLNTYESIGGVSITREGVVASGEFIDIMRGVDWLESRMEERIYARLVNLDKIPMTNAGIDSIVTEIRAQLIEAQDSGLIAPDSVDAEGNFVPGFTITSPNVNSISAADKASRTLSGISFTATLAGAVHLVRIEGNVTL